MSSFLDGLKWDDRGLVVAIVQHADTGEVLMQAFADRQAVCETLQTGYGDGDELHGGNTERRTEERPNKEREGKEDLVLFLMALSI